MDYPTQPSNYQFYNMQPAGTVPVEVVQNLMATKDVAYRVSIQNERLQQRLKEKALREDAYTVAFNENHCTWAISESGRFIELMDCCLEDAIRLTFDGPKSHSDLYLLRFSGKLSVAKLDEAVYLDDKRFLHALQLAGVQVHIRRSTRTTAALIRQCVAKVLESVEIRYYGGWEVKKAVPVFSAFAPFSSHRGADFLAVARPVQRLSGALETWAVKQFSAVFYTICSLELRWLVITWYHAAFLCSLLKHGDASLPMGLCFFTELPHVRLWFRHLFTWFNDGPINMDDRAVDVSSMLWRRKDQPVLLVDSYQTANASENARLIEEALATGKVFFRDGRVEKAAPLQGAVTLITNAISVLTCSPTLLVMEVGKGDFDLEVCQRYSENFPVNEDYLRTFADYTTAHWDELKKSLRKGNAMALSLIPDGGQNSLATMGTLLGVADFLGGFYRAHEVEDSPVPSAQDGLLEEIAALFQQESSSGTDAASQFCYIARMCLEHQVFTLCDEGQDDTGEGKPVVYLIGEDYGFSRKAFGEICRRMGQSTPTVAQSLAEAGLLRGKTTNSTTVQTRIPVCNVCGETRWIGVYRLAQEEILTAGF